ncbi:hypothetical protein QYE76_001956 [Lolium multiflorum]|uniref:Uncharacterized protein n=1 Tax=Lolium multiflorum TaxID=4521 RepID=A0AAD8RPR3_LOLMU|nr:hypothetical protein QYE76_001956 [Lolium multiflorum]
MGGSNPSLEDLLQSLKIKGDDLGGIFVPKAEVEALKEDSKWMAVLKVLTTKTFSASSLKQTLRFAWAPAQVITFRDLENGSFIVQAKCLGTGNGLPIRVPGCSESRGVRGRASINLLGVMIARRRERVAMLDARLVAMAEAEGEGVAVAGLKISPLMLEWKSPGEVGAPGENGAKKHLEFDVQEAEKVYPPPVGTPPPLPSAWEKKRPKKHAPAKQDLNTTVTAGSAAEHRPIQ